MKTLLKPFAGTLLLLGLCLVTFTACQSTLVPGGYYNPTNAVGQATQAPDKTLYAADGSFATAYAAMDAVFTFERANRAALWRVSPDIKHALDTLRPQAVSVRDQYVRARQAYLAQPVPANLTSLQTVLATLQSLAAAAVAVLPKP